MAKVKQTVKTRRRKTGGNSGYESCHICHGTGRVKKRNGGGGKRRA